MYHAEDFLGCMQQLTPHHDITHPACTLYPLRYDLLGIPSTILEGESIPFSLNLCNIGEADIFDIHLPVKSPNCNISWLDTDAERMGTSEINLNCLYSRLMIFYSY